MADISLNKLKTMRYAVPLVVGGSAVLMRMHIYRYVRRLLLPASVAAIIYRAIYCSNDESLLAIILQRIRESGNTASIVVGDAVGCWLAYAVIKSVSHAITLDITAIYNIVLDSIYDAIKYLPVIQKEIAKERAKMEEVIDEQLKTKTRAMGQQMAVLPKTGMSAASILSFLESILQKEDIVWEQGRVSGAVYHGDRAHQQLLNSAFSLYSLANPLHPDLWPSSTKLEAEIISMCASLMTTTLDSVCGSTTSGGTESIMLATKTHREHFRSKHGIVEPEIVACVSAHAAIDKACSLLGIRLIKVPMDPVTYKCDMVAMHRAIGPNTIMLYGSAPQYPQGVIDDIEHMSRLAVRYNIGLHVDCCLGGFVLPFARKLGYDIPAFDFDLPGVTSMSVDTHKFGYALKGTSVVLYRNQELRRSQYFCYPKFPGGLYTTPAIAGSRSSGMIAQCWASMVSLGEDGYLRHTRDIMECVKIVSDGVASIDGLRVVGQSQAMIVCFEADREDLNIYAVGDAMTKRGWALNLLQYPPGIHICCTVKFVGHEQEFLSELQEEVRNLLSKGCEKIGGTAAIYGMATSLPKGPVDEIMRAYHDAVYKM